MHLTLAREETLYLLAVHDLHVRNILHEWDIADILSLSENICSG